LHIRGIDGNLERKPLAKEAEDAVRFGGGVIDHSYCFSSIDGRAARLCGGISTGAIANTRLQTKKFRCGSRPANALFASATSENGPPPPLDQHGHYNRPR